jgi:hypothetical protein
MAKKNPKHLSGTYEWGTPGPILGRTRDVFGALHGRHEIDFDPASSELANERVQAKLYLGKDVDGLFAPWPVTENIFCNPPSEAFRVKGKPVSKAALFFIRFIDHIMAGGAGHGIFVCPSLELLQVSQKEKYGKSPVEHMVCFLRDRQRFFPLAGQKTSQMTHASAIVYIRGLIDFSSVFCERFSSLGGIMKGVISEREQDQTKSRRP